MELNIPFRSVHFAAIGSPSSFFNAGQIYSNDCVIAVDPGSVTHVLGCVVLNDVSHKIVLMVRNIPSGNINSSNIGVFGTFGRSRSRSRRSTAAGASRAKVREHDGACAGAIGSRHVGASRYRREAHLTACAPE
jgi:hypothetical protein